MKPHEQGEEKRMMTQRLHQLSERFTVILVPAKLLASAFSSLETDTSAKLAGARY